MNLTVEWTIIRKFDKLISIRYTNFANVICELLEFYRANDKRRFIKL